MKFKHEGKDYELNMTRAGLRAAEAQGLSNDEVASKPFTSLPLMFFAALYSKYRMNLNKSTAMLDDLLDSGELEFGEVFEKLVEDYAGFFGAGESEKPEK